MAEYQDQKQVIVVRKDLNMRKGKMIAQGAHASLAGVIQHGWMEVIDGKKYFMIPLDDEDLEAWLSGRFKKVAVYVNSEAELLNLHKLAQSLGLRSALIQDAGLTEFGNVPTYTTCAIGPHKPEDVDQVTGEDGPYGRLPLL